MVDIFRGFTGIWPKVAEGVFVADTARVIGDVEIGEDASVWYGSVLRGDVGSIRVGARSNIQDLSMLHMSLGISNTVSGEDVTVGHRVVIHGARIGDGALIGMGAIIMNGARIGKGCIVGAGSVITEGKTFEDRSLVIGAPARVIKTLTPEQVTAMTYGAAHYVHNGKRFKAGLKKIG